VGKKAALILAVVLIALAILPAMALASLTNEYGLNYAGQSKCLECHSTGDAAKFTALHSGFVTQGITPSLPDTWTMIRAAGNPPQIPGTNGALWDGGGEYSISGLSWLTLGNYKANSATEYLFFKGTTDPTVMPWNLIEGLAAEPNGEWMIAVDDPGAGLLDVSYGCQRCHQLGSTVPGAGVTVPNPAATIAASATTARQWARPDTKTVADFMADPTVSQAGMSIQCESCHGSGTKVAGGHMGIGTQINTSLEVLGQSQVCGQCHGSYTTMAGTAGLNYGYTPNLPLRLFADVNGVSSGQSYTKIPTVEEFLANPTAYWMFPNGSNAKGNHFYYDEWAASGHSYRSALTKDSPDAMAYQAAGNGHYSTKNMDPNLSGCYECHTGEGYLKSKNAKIAANFTPTADNVGFMGQECATCHTGHPTAVGAADAVREPDQAGVRSATGLSKANDSICEDCHNWQYEILGTTPVYAPVADLAGHASPSHPQRETLEGRSMVEIADAGKFMPGAKCEDCHMPKTNKAANRISHGMKPMLPGDAETWMTAAGGAYKGKDSCSTCHPSQTRTELQAGIDTWQTEAKAQAEKAAAAIKSAQKRKEYSLTDKKKPGYVLVGKATWNYKVFENDASSGVHNPRYIVAGLVKAQALSKSVGGSFKTVASSPILKLGRTGFVSGKLVNGDRSSAVGAKVVLYKNGKATKQVAMTDAGGAFSFAVAAKGKYSVVWQRASDKVTYLMSAIVSVR
jgi:hypothetical protein